MQAPIVNGFLEDDAPAVGMLRYLDAGEDRMQCTATLIAPQWALTASHCLTSFVERGGLDLVLGDERTAIDRLEVHPGYRRSVDHDIALVHLVTPSAVTPWAIARSTMVAPGDAVKVTGFGWTSLQAQDAGVQRSVWLGVHSVTRGWIADVYDGSGICHGDSGGPMYVAIDGIPTIVGVTSAFGSRLGDEDHPYDYCYGSALWSNVAEHATWIDAVIADALRDCRAMSVCPCDAACTADGTCDPSRCEWSCHRALTCVRGCESTACQEQCLTMMGDDATTKFAALRTCGLARQCDSEPDWMSCFGERCPDALVACDRVTPVRAPDCVEILRCEEGCNSNHCRTTCEEGATYDVWQQVFLADCPGYDGAEPEPELEPEPTPEPEPEAGPEPQPEHVERDDLDHPPATGCGGGATPSLFVLLALAAAARRGGGSAPRSRGVLYRATTTRSPVTQSIETSMGARGSASQSGT